MSSLTSHDLLDNNFNKIIDQIYKLSSIKEACFALAGIYEKLKKWGMLGSFQHFQTLLVIKKLKASSNFISLDAKLKCESAAQNTSAVFHKLLYHDTSNCRLLNRHFADEPIYCMNLQKNSTQKTDDYDHRRICTWKSKSDATDQYWNITVAENIHGVVHIASNRYSGYNLRYVNDAVRGCRNANSIDFRIHSKDDYLLLEPLSGELKRILYFCVHDLFNCIALLIQYAVFDLFATYMIQSINQRKSGKMYNYALCFKIIHI